MSNEQSQQARQLVTGVRKSCVGSVWTAQGNVRPEKRSAKKEGRALPPWTLGAALNDYSPLDASGSAIHSYNICSYPYQLILIKITLTS